jgi:serine/threonine-protein kinase
VQHTPRPLHKLGRFRLIRWLGGGGMGDVYLAHDPELDREVAVKVPRFTGRAEHNDDLRQRFLREARAAARVPHHPHLCPVFDAGEDAGQLFAVLAYAPGGSLAERLQRDGPMPPREAADVVRQAAEGLQALHAAGVVHRDIKPANLLLGATGGVLVSDFGVARLAESESMTAHGALLGTPAYLAPEQLERGAAAAGPASDVYALGVVLFELLTGRLPYEGQTMALLRQITDGPPEALLRPDLDVALEALVLWAMARQPQERPTAAALAASLTAWLGGAPFSAPAGAVAATRLEPPACQSQPGSAARRAAGGYRGWIDARVWQRGKERGALRLAEPGAVPLRPGDLVRVEADIDPPAYLYVVVIDPRGKAAPLYPWHPGQWGSRLAEEGPRRQLLLPEQADSGWEVGTGEAGMETLLLLARPAPLENVDLAALLSELPPQRQHLTPPVVWFENGAVVQRSRAFASFDPKPIHDPVLQMQALLRERLGPLFGYTLTVSYAVEGG